ncbi:MAG: cupredoxin domain-containing protein [Microthrixaceae bacterium]
MNVPKLGVVAAIAGMIVANALIAPASEADVAQSRCAAEFTVVSSGPPAADGTQAGHGEGECSTTFEGFPLGAIGVSRALDPVTGEVVADAPVDIHVEVWLRLANGTGRKYAECEAGNPDLSGPALGEARCEVETNGETATPVALPGALPREVVGVECLAHSHGRMKVGTTPIARFGCYSGEASRDALLEEIDGPVQTSAAPLRSQAVITSVPSNTYAPTEIVVAAGGEVTYANADLGVWHDVVASDAVRPAGSAPWCSTRTWTFYGLTGCPLFASALLQGAVGATTPVLGVSDAQPGDYLFFCTIHPDMVGVIRVVGA